MMLLELAVHLAHDPHVHSASGPNTPMAKGKFWRVYYHLCPSKN